jgi:hypothetical protein
MAATTERGEEVVVLRNGPSVPLSTLRLLWNLEARGFALTPLPNGRLRVTPNSRLTAQDDDAIRRHRDELLALVKYSEVIQ